MMQQEDDGELRQAAGQGGGQDASERMLSPGWLAVAAAFGFLGVAFGAFAAHALQASLEPKALDWIETASRYWLYHAPVMLFLALGGVRRSSRLIAFSAWPFALGGVLFSGSLVMMALSGTTAAALVTPLGGTLLLLGWLLLGGGGLAAGVLAARR